MQLYTFQNPFIKKTLPFSIFRIAPMNADGKTVTYKGVKYYVCDTDAIMEQNRKANIIKVIGAYTVFCWFHGNDTGKCRIEVMRSDSATTKIYTRLYIDGTRDYVHPISVVDNIAAQNLVDNLLNETL